MTLALINTASNTLLAITERPFKVNPPLKWLDVPQGATETTHVYNGTQVVLK